MDVQLREATADEASFESPFKLYHYDPTTAGAMIFVLLFSATTILHFWQLLRSRCWFAIPLAIGGIFEAIGYASRFASGKESPNWTLTPYIIQAILLLVAPALFAASIYMELARIIVLVDGESRAWLSKKWMTKIFVIGDVLSFIMQGGGGGYQASGTLAALKTGANIIIAGLFVQLIFFSIFIVTAVAFNMAINRSPTGSSRNDATWRKHLRVLYISSVIIMLRSIFRAVEYLQGFNGYLLRHEVYLYIFDALLMFIVMGLFNYIHPGEITALLRNKERNGGWKTDIGGHQLQRIGSEDELNGDRFA
ncbi:hypothetical protein ACQRIT_005767 [Beauveria bassiana]